MYANNIGLKDCTPRPDMDALCELTGAQARLDELRCVLPGLPLRAVDALAQNVRLHPILCTTTATSSCLEATQPMQMGGVRLAWLRGLCTLQTTASQEPATCDGACVDRRGQGCGAIADENGPARAHSGATRRPPSKWETFFSSSLGLAAILTLTCAPAQDRQSLEKAFKAATVDMKDLEASYVACFATSIPSREGLGQASRRSEAAPPVAADSSVRFRAQQVPVILFYFILFIYFIIIYFILFYFIFILFIFYDNSKQLS